MTTPAVRPARPGTTYSRQVEGGCRRTQVPSPGAVVDLEDRDVFIPAASLAEALRQLGYTVTPPAPGRKRRP